MTLPIETLPDSTYMVGRRCLQMTNFLVPHKDDLDGEIANIFGYCVAYAAWVHDIQVHGWVVLMCQWYAVVSDPHGRIPEFLRDVHRLVGSCMRAKLGHAGHFWNIEKPTRVRLDSLDERLQSLLEVMTLPVEEAFVPTAGRWVSQVTVPEDIGVKMTFTRPAYFFRETGEMPETIGLTLTPLPGCEDQDRDDYVEMLRAKVAEREDELHENMKKSNDSFMSPRRLAAVLPHHRHRCTKKSADPAKRAAYMNKYRERQAAKRRPKFQAHYRASYVAWSKGINHDAIFPAGTYALSRYACVKIAPVKPRMAA